MNIKDKIDNYLNEEKVTLPKKLYKMSDSQLRKTIKTLIKNAAKLPDSQMAKNQRIADNQHTKVTQGLIKNHGNEWMKGGSGIEYNGQDVDELLLRLSLMKEIYAVASDVGSFGSKPEDWVDRIMMYARGYR